jgi:hypothetical protein
MRRSRCKSPKAFVSGGSRTAMSIRRSLSTNVPSAAKRRPKRSSNCVAVNVLAARSCINRSANKQSTQHALPGESTDLSLSRAPSLSALTIWPDWFVLYRSSRICNLFLDTLSPTLSASIITHCLSSLPPMIRITSSFCRVPTCSLRSNLSLRLPFKSS